MEKDELIERINKATNILDKLRADLINEDREKKKSCKKTYKTKDLAKECDIEFKTDLEEQPQQKDFKDLNTLNKEIEIKHLLGRYSCFAECEKDTEFIEDLLKILDLNNINLKELDSALERIKYANDKQPKNDIKKYTFSCLYNIKRA